MEQIPPEAIPGLLGDLERIRAALWGRMMSSQASVNHQAEARVERRFALSAYEVAGRLGRLVSYVRALCRQGQITASKAGKDWLIPPEAVEEWLEKHRHNPGPAGISPPSRARSAPRLQAVPKKRKNSP